MGRGKDVGRERVGVREDERVRQKGGQRSRRERRREEKRKGGIEGSAMIVKKKAVVKDNRKSEDRKFRHHARGKVKCSHSKSRKLN